MRRWVSTLFIIGLIILLFWRDLLSIGLQGVVHWQSKYQIAFRQLNFRHGQIVLNDVLVLGCSKTSVFCRMHAKQVRCSLKTSEKPYHLHIAFDEPHLTILDSSAFNPRHLVESRSHWLTVSLSVENGSFEWNDHKNDLFAGRFSLKNEKLELEADGGRMSAQLIRNGHVKTIDCSLEQMPVDWLSPRIISWDCRGKVSGALFLNINHRKIQSVNGRLRWDQAAFSINHWHTAGGASSIEWEGEYTFEKKTSFHWLDAVLSFPDRMKIQFHNGFIVQGQGSFENLEGIFFTNPGIGLKWAISGPSFSWEGKGFSKSCSMNWLESSLCMYDSKLFLRAEQLNAASSRSFLELQKADGTAIRLISDLWPALFPCHFDDGNISARMIWEERNGAIIDWKLEQMIAEKIAIHGDDWSLQCDLAQANMDHAGNALMSAKGANLRWKNVDISSFQADCLVRDQIITAGSFGGIVNGLEADGFLTGSCKEISLHASHHSGLESIETKADLIWDGRAFAISSADVTAHHLDIDCLRSFFEIDCEGIADLIMNYADGELKLEAAGSKLKVKGQTWDIAVDSLGQSEPFEAGIKAVWEQSSRQWTAQTTKTRCNGSMLGRKIAFDGQMELSADQLKICVGQGNFEEVSFAGDWMFILHDNIPFSFISHRVEGDLERYFPSVKGHFVCENDDFRLGGDLFSDPALWQWTIKADVSQIQWGLLHDGKARLIADSKEGLIECSDLNGFLIIGHARFGFCGAKLRKCEQKWDFDFRVEHGIWDWGRLAGTAEIKDHHLVVYVDSSKSHLLNAPIHLQESVLSMNGSIESMKLFYDLDWSQLLAAAPIFEKIDHSLSTIIRAPIRGKSFLAIDIDQDRTFIALQGDNLQYNNESMPFEIRICRQKEAWEVDRLIFRAIQLSCSLEHEEEGWKIVNGLFQWKDCLQARVGGFLRSFSKYEFLIDQLVVNLQNLTLPFLKSSLEGTLEGKGSLIMEWDGEWKNRADFELRAFHANNQMFSIQNASDVHIHFSDNDGLLVRGLDCQIYKSDLESPWIHSCIGLIQFDIHRHRWLFNHSQIRMFANSIGEVRSQLDEGHPLKLLMQAVDSQHDLEFVADLDCFDDFSSLTCSMREGFIPFLGAVRHLQNVNLSWNLSEMRAAMSVIQGGHSLRIGAWMEFAPTLSGRVFLEDEEHQLIEKEMPLTIEWGIEANRGIVIRSIEGTFGGIEASFHAENAHSLIGSTRIHFEPLSEILPPRLGKVFQQLKMGKGYELKGRLFYDNQDWSNLSFRGLFSGKQCELFGFQIRNLLTQIEIHPSHVHFFEMKASDSAGILTMDELQIQQEFDDRWTIAMPLLKLQEFRPSLLQKVGREMGHVGPLVVREFKLMDLKGCLEDSSSLTAKGALSFVNSFKREHTVFDLPSDFFGRIIGLDMELLIPVRGKLKFELKEGRFWLFDLEDAYSEGKRSKFFLVKEGTSPTVDLDGNLHIFVTMKQYVLFKITENFLLTIDGPIESPFFHLQKKSKLLGLCGY